MSWINTMGADPEFILYSKAKYVRNAARLSFGSLADSKKLAELHSRIDKLLTGNGFTAEKHSSGSTSLLSLVERQLADPSVAAADGPVTVYINDPCNITASLGTHDLVTIQSTMSGRAVSEAKNSAATAEEMLDSDVIFAYSEDVGYLCQRPEKCGSCLELSVCAFLPSIRALCDLESTRRALLCHGIELYPLINDGDNAGDLYVISYTPNHLACEDSAARYLDLIAGELCHNEEKRLGMLYPSAREDIADAAFRALGILSNARKISESDMLMMISSIRLSLCLKCEEACLLPTLSDLNFLTLECLDCSVASTAKTRCTSQEDIDKARAELLRKYISAKVKALAEA